MFQCMSCIHSILTNEKSREMYDTTGDLPGNMEDEDSTWYKYNEYLDMVDVDINLNIGWIIGRQSFLQSLLMQLRRFN